MTPGRSLAAARLAPAQWSAVVGAGTTAAMVLGAGAFAALSIAAFPSPVFPFLVVAGLFAMGLAIAHPPVVVMLGVLAIPFEGYTTFIIGPAQALFGVAALGWLVRRLTSRPVTLPRHSALAAFAALVLVNGAGLVFAAEPSVVARQVVTWGTLLLVAGCVAETRGHVTRNVLFSIAACAFIAGVIAVVDPQAHLDRTRAQAGFGSPNALGMLLAIAVPIQVLFALRGPTSIRAVAAGGIVLSLVGMMLAASRGAFLGLAASLVVLALWAPFLRAAFVAIPVVLTLAIITDAPLSSYEPARTTVERLTELRTDAQTDGRLLIWKVAPRMISDRPLFGVGALEFGHWVPSYGVLGRPNPPNHAHNTPLTLAVELGLLGLAAFLALMVSVGKTLLAVMRRGSAEARAMAYALAAALTAFLANGIVDYHLGSPLIASAVFVLVGCAVALALGTSRAEPARCR